MLRKNDKAISRLRGFSLIELMVGMVVGLLVSAAAIAAFSAHSNSMYQQIAYAQATEDVAEVFELLSRLLRQAEINTLTIADKAAKELSVASGADAFSCTTDITITFTVPSGFAIWPNLTSPYTGNEIQLALSDTGDNAFAITIANGGEGASGSATRIPLAGSAQANNTRIICMDLTRQSNGTYAFSITGHAGQQSASEVTFSGVIMPRNFRKAPVVEAEEEA